MLIGLISIITSIRKATLVVSCWMDVNVTRYVCASKGVWTGEGWKKLEPVYKLQYRRFCQRTDVSAKEPGMYFIVSQIKDEGTDVGSVDKFITAMLDAAKEMEKEEDEQVEIVDSDQG